MDRTFKALFGKFFEVWVSDQYAWGKEQSWSLFYV